MFFEKFHACASLPRLLRAFESASKSKNYRPLLLPDLVASPGIAADEVGHDVVVILRASYFHLGKLESAAIEEKSLVQGGHSAGGEIQHHKTADGIKRNDFSGEGIVRGNNGGCRRICRRSHL